MGAGRSARDVIVGVVGGVVGEGTSRRTTICIIRGSTGSPVVVTFFFFSLIMGVVPPRLALLPGRWHDAMTNVPQSLCLRTLRRPMRAVGRGLAAAGRNTTVLVKGVRSSVVSVTWPTATNVASPLCFDCPPTKKLEVEFGMDVRSLSSS